MHNTDRLSTALTNLWEHSQIHKELWIKTFTEYEHGIRIFNIKGSRDLEQCMWAKKNKDMHKNINGKMEVASESKLEEHARKLQTGARIA